MLLLIEEAALPFIFDLEGSFDQEDRSLDAVFNGKDSLVTGHVSLDVSWTAHIDLNVLLLDILIFGQS